MGSQVRNDRGSRSRYNTQSTRREWVPRSSATSATSALVQTSSSRDSTVSAPVQASSSSTNPIGNNGNSSRKTASSMTRYRGHNSSKGRMIGGVNHGLDKERSDSKDVEGSKDSNLPQLVQEIQEKLMKGAVECMICYDMVKRSMRIWSCSSCYSIFHLHCIKKWARAPTSADFSAESNQGINWRCPGCQFVQLTSSKDIRYVCFCGKRTDPPSDPYLTPHSCGEPCGKPLEKKTNDPGISREDLCPHVCVLQCHPGPCPPCKAFAPPRFCPCGKNKITTRCSDRISVLTCGQQCSKLLDCGRHRCERLCHVGPCGPCGVVLNAHCFCKKKMEVVICGDMILKGEINPEDGVFSCDSTCGKQLQCGNHSCSDVCHRGPCEECALLPSRIKSCYCGKTSLEKKRQSCLDPIPMCSNTCEKLLSCGMHHCIRSCHAGDCPPCLVSVSQKCRCGSTSRNVECHKATSEADTFTCSKPCGKKKNCGRHRCSVRCCPLSNPKNNPIGDWDPHFCRIPCGKKLRCGQHYCESLCHLGHCPPCLETIFTDLTCACGRTSIPPPLPCGTPPPSCQFPCAVRQACGHTATHGCHLGGCPPCSVPVEKKCIGGHVVLRNIPCGSKDIRCNKLCGKTRRCGMHACARTCHPAPCDAESGSEMDGKASCGQTCGAPRRDCRHTCTALCHPSSPCPDTRCEFSVTISCSCGRITASVPCDAGGSTSVFNSDTVYEASILQKLPVPLQPMEVIGKRIPLGERKLMCDDECARLERKRVLADAFNITPPNLDALHFGENSLVTEMLSDMYRRDPKWVLAVEERCKFLVLGKGRGTSTAMKVHVFCPMTKDKRDGVRVIAERWKLAINAAGREPRRFIVVHVTPKSKPPPRIIGVKGSLSFGAPNPPAYDYLVDMDPKLVVAFLDLPREADISALVLRFGGECELVWLNDKNALAVFSDPARAATAMRRLEHGSAYTGAVLVVQNAGLNSSVNNAWGAAGLSIEGPSSNVKGNAWKRPGVLEASWTDDSWGGEDSPRSFTNLHLPTWRGNSAPIATLGNRWSVLGTEKAVNAVASSGNEVQVKQIGGSRMASDRKSSGSALPVAGNMKEDLSDVVDDWEEACD